MLSLFQNYCSWFLRSAEIQDKRITIITTIVIAMIIIIIIIIIIITNINWTEWITIARVISKSDEREVQGRFEITSTITP